jgi:mRNA interferase MazF
MKRGDIVLVVVAGEFGKPRPAVVVQSDKLSKVVDSVLVGLITTHQSNVPLFRVPVEPTMENGLMKSSEIMVDKVMAISQSKIGGVIGKLDAETLQRLNRTLAFVMGLGQ